MPRQSQYNNCIATNSQANIMQTPQQQIIAKCKEIIGMASKLYDIDLSTVKIDFNLKGRAAGRASRVNCQYTVSFNADMLHREAFDHLLNATVPHEFAHIICFMRPSLGDGHNSGWERVCKSLGGSGARFHKEDVVFGKGITAEYITTTGKTVRISQVVHKRVQSGVTYSYRDGSKITKECSFTIVGHRGHTLAAPVVPKQATKEVPAAAIIRPAPVAVTQPKQTVQAFSKNLSKDSIVKAIKSAGKALGKDAETMIAAIMSAISVDRNIAIAYFNNIK